MTEVIGLLSAQLAAFGALLLLASGSHKILRADRARSVINEFAGVPLRWARGAAGGVAGMELLAGVLLWLPAYRALGAALAAVVWVSYLLLILRALADGRRDVDCGCSFATAHSPLGLFQVVRNIALVACAALIAIASVRGSAGPVMSSQVLAAFALLALYGALDQVMALQPPRTGELL